MSPFPQHLQAFRCAVEIPWCLVSRPHALAEHLPTRRAWCTLHPPPLHSLTSSTHIEAPEALLFSAKLFQIVASKLPASPLFGTLIPCSNIRSLRWARARLIHRGGLLLQTATVCSPSYTALIYCQSTASNNSATPLHIAAMGDSKGAWPPHLHGENVGDGITADDLVSNLTIDPRRSHIMPSWSEHPNNSHHHHHHNHGQDIDYRTMRNTHGLPLPFRPHSHSHLDHSHLPNIATDHRSIMWPSTSTAPSWAPTSTMPVYFDNTIFDEQSVALGHADLDQPLYAGTMNDLDVVDFGQNNGQYDYFEPQQAISSAPDTPDQYLVEVDDESDRSDKCYAKLIFECLLEAPDYSRPLKEIYNWVLRNSAKVREDPSHKGWQNSVRHNLSMNHVSSLFWCSSSQKHHTDHITGIPKSPHPPPSEEDQPLEVVRRRGGSGSRHLHDQIPQQPEAQEVSQRCYISEASRCGRQRRQSHSRCATTYQGNARQARHERQTRHERQASTTYRTTLGQLVRSTAGTAHTIHRHTLPFRHGPRQSITSTDDGNVNESTVLRVRA